MQKKNTWIKILKKNTLLPRNKDNSEKELLIPAQRHSAPLPEKRITEASRFEIAGVDFPGPLYCKSENKVYIALFTCAVTQTFQLELVTDMTSEK